MKGCSIGNIDISKILFQDKTIYKKQSTTIDVVKDGLFCWLDARDGKGTETTWIDRSGNGNNAFLVGFNFDSNNGWINNSLKFNGVNTYVELITIASKINFKKDFTIQVNISDFSANQSKNADLLCFTGYPVGLSLSVYLDRFCVKDWNFITPTFMPYTFLKTLTDSKVGFTITHSVIEKKIKIYIDGVQTLENTYTDLTDKYTENYYLKLGGTGHSGFTGQVSGNYSSLILYTKCLTEKEIQQNIEYENSIDRIKNK